MKKNVKKINLNSLEMLDKTNTSILIGGFSAVKGGQVHTKERGTTNSNCAVTNNCMGANCAYGCGANAL
jgi:hypothetical protein